MHSAPSPVNETQTRQILCDIARITIGLVENFGIYRTPGLVARGEAGGTLGARFMVVGLNKANESQHQSLARNRDTHALTALMCNLHRMVADAAPCLDHPGIEIDLELSQASQDGIDGAAVERAMDYNLSFNGVALCESPSQGGFALDKADGIARRLCEMTALIADNAIPAYRIFDICDCHIPAVSAPDALRIYCAISGIDPATIATGQRLRQIRVAEILCPQDVLNTLLDQQSQS